ncbi:hypothetical protein HJG60_010447 [Phyllostomus discolor]|uniref:Uncharacterized protein n=1 Tax=Phyllostomus discolor TaxID=89673 RepID=A0A834AHA6_9CHIR|nr:hypothetical protein HJG60_010447 [Phyllostomus discolor]
MRKPAAGPLSVEVAPGTLPWERRATSGHVPRTPALLPQPGTGAGGNPHPRAASLSQEARRLGRDNGELRFGSEGQGEVPTAGVHAQSTPTLGLRCILDNPSKQQLLAPRGPGVSRPPWPGVPRCCRCCLGADRQGGAGVPRRSSGVANTPRPLLLSWRCLLLGFCLFVCFSIGY